MPDEVGGQPFPDGEDPNSRDHGAADDEFASVVLDEDFVRAAEVHEPTAVERILAAAQFRAEMEGTSGYEDGYGYQHRPESEFDRDDLDDGFEIDPEEDDEGRFDRSDYTEYAEYAEYVDGRPGPRVYRGHVRWQRPVAWVLAVVMGVGMVAMAFAAVYRGASGERGEPTTPPPATEMDVPMSGSPGAFPSVSADTEAPTSAAEPSAAES